MGSVLVTGGAGYIGSHVVRALQENGRNVVVVDDLSTGHRRAVSGVEFVEGDFGERGLIDRIIEQHSVSAVVHMAASAEVAESVVDPAAYYRNNLVRGLSLLDSVTRFGVRSLVFSSTAAVYGEPASVPIDESHPQRPTNPYGETKLAFERALSWYHGALPLDFVALRYFNAAGAHPDGSIGEHHDRESHLIPRLLLDVLDPGEPVPIFGTDYPTPDGTCVRDYVHVVDLARAHVLALEALEGGAGLGDSFNLGNGDGYSVNAVVDAVEQVTGKRPGVRPAPRRAGDPARLVASAERARERFGWRPEFPTIEAIVETAWCWHQGHPEGYETSRAAETGVGRTPESR